jgi:hypothetical protein
MRAGASDVRDQTRICRERLETTQDSTAASTERRCDHLRTSHSGECRVQRLVNDTVAQGARQMLGVGIVGAHALRARRDRGSAIRQ